MVIIPSPMCQYDYDNLMGDPFQPGGVTSSLLQQRPEEAFWAVGIVGKRPETVRSANIGGNVRLGEGVSTARSGRTLNCGGGWNRNWRSWSRSGRTLARSVTSELPGASSQRDSAASINTPLTLSLRGWRDGCGRRGRERVGGREAANSSMWWSRV